MTWLYLNRNAIWLMAPKTNQFLSKHSYKENRLSFLATGGSSDRALNVPAILAAL
jgi:hypothetical protein